MRPFPVAGTLIAALALAAPSAQAQEPRPIKLETYTLENGLKVVLAEDHSTQVVAVNVWYNVGSRNERSGRTGFAHLFEHMMYQGSQYVAKGAHMSLLEQAGSQGFNGSTAEDRTNYYQPMPSNRLNLGLWLEADRMRSLQVTDTNFTNQREAVKEERRLRVDNQPYMGALFEQSYGAIDSATCFPYSHSIIGSMDDLNAARTADVQQFFNLYYAPNNAVLVVSGDFEPAETKRLIQQYYGDIPRGQTPPPVQCQARFSVGARRRHVFDAKANLPATIQIYTVPAYDHADYPALELLGMILGDGQSSRLTRTLQRESKVAVATPTFVNPFGPRRGPGQFMLWALANQGVNVDSLDRMLSAQVALLVSGGVTEEELTKVKNSYRASTIMSRTTPLDVSDAVHVANLFLGSPEAVNTSFARYMRVTVDDIKRVAATYLVPQNSYTMIITSEPAQ